MRTLPRSWSIARSRLLVMLAIQLVSLPLATGCSASTPPAAAAPPSPPADAPAPSPPPAASVDVSAGYAPSAPMAAPPPMAGPSPGAQPASFRQPPPSAAPARGPAAKAAAPPPPPVKPAPPAAPHPGKAPPAPVPARAADKGAAPPAAPAPAGPAAPLLIYVGDLQMLVEDGEVAATIDRIIDLAESLGGYLAGRKDTSVQVRVPSYRFRDSLTGIEKLGEVTHRSVTADDVSEQYNDLEVRLVNLKATRQRLQEFLARAANVAEALQVAHELERVAGEMEQIEGKMRFLRSRAAFSLVTINLTAKPKPVAKVVNTPPPPPPRVVGLPIDWLSRVGLDRLLNLR